MPGVRFKPDREAMIPVPGGRAYVRVDGDLRGPRPPIVFLHGGPGSSHWYFLNATAMAGERAVILYDQLDSGRSDHPGIVANWNVPRFVAELEAIRVALDVPRWHILGASWGGTVALEYAAQRPPALASAVLQSPLVSTEVWLRDARILKDGMPPATRKLLDDCDTPGAAAPEACTAATDAFYRRHVNLTEPGAAVTAYRAGLPRAFSADIYNAMWGRAEFTATGTLKDYDGRPLLKQLDGARTLFLAGEYDEARPATVQGFAHEAGASFAVVPAAAHMALGDNPAGYLRLLRPWLAAHDHAAA
ncbi:proline iminopeptidase-family hydrolase [Sphingosinicellaceae bacterium]|nr:proline iminopeptidase-family hydrolase [Sphingosinicellaceae bacterium]